MHAARLTSLHLAPSSFSEPQAKSRGLQVSRENAQASMHDLSRTGPRSFPQRCYMRARGTFSRRGNLELREGIEVDHTNTSSFHRSRASGPTASAALHASAEKDVANLKSELLSTVKTLERGTKNSQAPEKFAKAMELLQQIDAKTACSELSAEDLTADWKLVWTTEKETLFILQRAGVFGTAAGNVWQIINAHKQTLSNIIEFPPSGRFAVAASIRASDPGNFKRVEFKFESAELVTPKWTLPVPPFGKGWFQTVYIDEQIRIAKDSRKDWLIVERAERLV